MQVTGRLYPDRRLVVTPGATSNLMQKLQQVTAAALVQARRQKNTQPQLTPESNGGDRKIRKSIAG